MTSGTRAVAMPSMTNSQRLLRILICWAYCTCAFLARGSRPVLLRGVNPRYTIDPQETPTFKPCSFYGDPIPTVFWSRESKRLSISPTNGPYYTSDGTLVLTHASPADSGNYTCTGVNSRGNSSVSTEITIQHNSGKSDIGTHVGLIFLYAILVWLILSAAIAGYMKLRARRHHHPISPSAVGHEMNEMTDNVIANRQAELQPPPEWEHQTNNLELFSLTRGSEEWEKVEKHFKTTMTAATVNSITRIQNKWLWKKYINEKDSLHHQNKGRVNEKELFHGTRGNDPKEIYNGQQGFDMRLSNSGLWGQANYFAVNANYSDGYAFTRGGYREMFLVKVLTGDNYESPQNSQLRLPPKKETIQAHHKTTVASNRGVEVNERSRADSLKFEIVRYDTVTGTTGGSRVFMTYDNAKAYPAYLIQYKK